MDRRRFLAAAGTLAGAGWLGACRGREDPPPGAAPGDLSPEPFPAATSPSPSPSPYPDPTPPDSPPQVEDPPVEVARLEVLCRDAWGALAASGPYTDHRVVSLTVHHSAVALGDNRAAPSRLRQHQRFHQEQGWPDIAYHFAVDRNGHVYELRPYAARGDTFTDYDPTGHLGVLAEGNFDQEQPTDAQLEGLALVLAWAADTLAVDVATLSGHRDLVPSTRCPGDALYRHLADGSLSRQVDALLAAGGVDLAEACGPQAVERVAAIEAGSA